METKQNLERTSNQITKWYSSNIADYVGIAALITSLAFGGATFMRGCSDSFESSGPSNLEKMRIIKEINQSYKLQEADLNSNGIIERFYTIDGKVALVELDGQPILEYAKSQGGK